MTSPVFSDWHSQPLEEVFYICRETLEDTDFPTVKKWRDDGGKVLGHFQVYFPEEIAHAAGMLPVKMRGAPLEPTLADSHFGSYLCSILKTSFETMLSGKLELDMFVSHPICDAARNLAAIWGRNVDYPCPILYLPQNPNSSHAKTFLKEEYEGLQETIESVAGRRISTEDLNQSIVVFNDNRQLIRQLYNIRREMPWLMSADELYSLLAMGGYIPREEHNDMIQWVLHKLPTRSAKPQDRIRVVFEGGFCEQPPMDMIRMLGRSCYVVDDDLLIGMRYLLEDVASDGDPLLNLAHAYLEQSSYSPVQHDLRKPKETMLLNRIRNAKADAAIICAAKMCEPGLEEQVTYATMLDAEQIPYFLSEFEENMTSFDHLELQIETFLENLLFA
jgi:benzoyl-CoA reductase subunit C